MSNKDTRSKLLFLGSGKKKWQKKGSYAKLYRVPPGRNAICWTILQWKGIFSL